MSELEAVSAEYDSQITKAKQQALVYKQQIKQQNAKIAKLEEEARKKAEEEARKKAEAAKTNNTNNTTVKANGTAAVDKQSILAANGSAQGKEIAIYACGFVGNPYVLGGTSLTSGADCSGFTQAVYKAFGYKIPRTSYQQRSVGKEVSYAEAQPGDLICYAGHVVHKKNINELYDMYEEMKKLDIDIWRVINIEPIGRARDNKELLLEKEDYITLLDFIKTNREKTLFCIYSV